MATREDILTELNRRRVQEELATRGAQPAQDESFAGASVIEPLAAVASGAIGTVAGGLAGLAQSVNPFADKGAGAEAAQEVQEALTFQPRTPAGQAGIKTLGDLAQKGIDIANFPISGLAGLAELAAGQGLEQAAKTIQGVQEQGAGKTAGARVLETTGSPLAATAVETAISGAGDIAGLKGLGIATKPAGAAIKTVGEVTAITPIFKTQSATKQRIAKLIEQGSTDIETAQFKLTPDSAVPPTKIEKFLKIGGPRIQKDATAIETIRQGFDEGAIAALKGSQPADKAKMSKMVNIMERGKKNAKFAVLNRPGDVVGDSLLERLSAVKQANKQAGRDLDNVLTTIKADGGGAFPDIDVKTAAGNFMQNLEDIGVSIGDDLKPVFIGSDIEDLAAPTNAIKRIVSRLSRVGKPTAADLHRVKKLIDETVTFGKSAEGLSGKTERILKSLRHDINEAIGDKIPEYREANKAYSETIGAIDALQDVAGKKMNLEGANAQKATGVLLRRLMGNTQSRANLIDAIKTVEDTANKYGRLKKNSKGQLLLEQPGGTSPLFSDDIITQAMFADELDSVFGPVGRTSFQGQIDQALKRGVQAATTQSGAIDAGVSAVAKGIEKVRGINQEGAFRSIKELLKTNE